MQHNLSRAANFKVVEQIRWFFIQQGKSFFITDLDGRKMSRKRSKLIERTY